MRKLIIIMISLFVLFLFCISIFYIPRIRERQQFSKLEKEVSLVNNYIIHNKGNITYINNYINDDITTGDRVVIEKAIDLYLIDLLDIYNESLGLNRDLLSNKIDVDFSKDDIQSKMNEIITIKDSINNFKVRYDEIDSSKYIKSQNKNIVDKYSSIISKIDKNNIDSNIDISKLDIKYQIYEFLNNNLNYFNVDNGIIFNKLVKYNAFKNIVENSDIQIDYKLIDDTVGPVINANNIYITEGDYITLTDKISCIDEVDDVVNCEISGSYNSNIVGNYTINIKASDSSNNVTNKSINIVVKEKEKYNLPYVIEVVRNQSTTIVYGKDDNGEYTNIVGVFPCSPGAGGNTPLGTFYSKRGSEWGGLFGNVYGQYSTVITGHVLFHSVPYHSTNKGDLVWQYYNQLGTKVSMGCIRLTVRDAKWIFDNCPSGTMIKIYDGDLPAGVSKPEAQKIDGNDSRRGWDPTDPDPANPWNQ